MSNDVANIRSPAVAAATAVVGYDLLKDVPENRLPYARIIDGFAYVGANAAAESTVEIWINGVKKGTYANSSTGLVIDQNKDLMGMNLYIAANEQLQAIVKTAPTVSPVVVQFEMHAPAKTFSGRRTGYRRSSSSRRSPRTTRPSTTRRF